MKQNNIFTDKKWYVIQTLKGQENKIAEKIRNEVAGEDEAVFVFEREKEYRIKKQWVKDKKPFFPGYIFVELDEKGAVDFNIRMRKIKRRLLAVDGEIMAIKPEEQEYLVRIGGEDHVIYHSQGFRVEDYVAITAGPFKGYNGEIRKLDRHHRKAEVLVRLLGRDIPVEIGLEIVEHRKLGDPGSENDTDKFAKIVTGV